MAIQQTLTTILEEEINKFTQAALCQWKPNKKNYRSGYYERDLIATISEIKDMLVSWTQDGFHTKPFDHYQQRQAVLDKSIYAIFVKDGIYGRK